MTASSRPEEYDAIVVGAGANGLVAALALARTGRRVLVLEERAEIGGLARTVQFAPGFRAPLSLDAGWLPPTVARGLGLPPIPMVDPALSIALATGGDDGLVLPRDPARAAEAIRRHSPRDASRWSDFVTRLRRLSGFLEALAQLPPPDVGADSLGALTPLLGLARRFRALGRADMTELLRVLPMAVQDLLDDWFESERLQAAVGAGGVRDIRQGPRSGGTSFILLHYLLGAPAGSVRARAWWRDGPTAFIDAVAGAARSIGATIRTGAPVARILVRDDAVAGVALASGDEIAARIVVSTADPVRTLLGLVDPVWLDPELLLAVRNIKLRGCTAVVHYALDALPDLPGVADARQALAGVVSLTPSLDALERAADAAKYGTVSEHPHVEIGVPTLRWPTTTLAPEGRHVLVARAQYAPYRLRDGAPWDAGRATALGDAVTRAIGEAMPGFADRVLHRAVLGPADLEARFGVTGGALTHGELTLDQILFMRPVPGWGRYAMPVRGLYLGGAGAHPGPGVLGGAGWLAAKQALAQSSS